MKRKLLLAALCVVGALGMRAQTDVTDTYITNAGFETSPIFDGTSLGASGTNATPTDGSTLITGAVNAYEISGWTNMTDATTDFARVFTMPYNTTLYVQGNNSAGGQAVAAPANGSSVTESNNSLLFVEANWCQNAVLGIKQTATLPAGVYKLTFDTYVTTTVANAMSLCGVKIGDLTTYKWPTAVNTWTNNEIYFTLDASTAVEFSMGYKKLGNVGGGSSAFLFVDNLKLVQIKNTAAAAATDVTSQIANADASAAWGSPWTHSGDLQDNRNTNNGYDGQSGFFEPSKWGSDSWGGTMYTDLSGLSNGLYILKAAVQSAADVHTRLIAGTSNSSEFPANGTTNGTIASDGSVVAAGSGVDGWNFGSTSAWVTDGTLRIGVYTAAWAIQKWTNIDNFTLKFIPASEFLNLDEYISLLESAQSAATTALANSDYDNVTGTERSTLTTASTKTVAESTAAAYEELIDEVNAALSAFTSAKANYDAFATEKAYAESLGMTVSTAPTTAAAALEAVNTVKVDEYSFVTTNFSQDFTSTYLATPTTNTFDALSAQHWSGETHSYFNFWKGSSADRELTYAITLPEGKYIIKAAGRGQANTESRVSISDGTTTVNFTMKGDTGLGINKNGVTSFDASDAAGFANNNNGRGWEWRYLLIDLDEETKLTLSLTGHVNNSWIGACDFALLTTADNSAINRAAYQTALAAATSARDNATYSNITGTEKANLNTAIATDVSAGTASAYDTAKDALETATAAFTAAKSAYDAFDAMYTAATTLAGVANDNASANSTYSSAISAANSSTNQTAAEKTAALKSAVNTYIAAANPTGDAKFDLTFMLTNPDLTGNSWVKVDGWYTDQTFETQNSQAMYTEGEGYYYEYWSAASNATSGYTVYLKVTLPEGTYQMTAKAKAGWGSAATNNGGTQAITFSAGDTDGSSITATTLADASIDFVNTSESEVKIGLKAHEGNTCNWMGIGYVQLYKVPAVTITIDEEEDYTPESVAGEVTLKRTLSSTTWNTFVVPFQITNEELKAAFGDDVAVATFTEVADGENSTINFNTMTTPAITANTPVLLKPATIDGDNSYVFANRTVATGDAKVAGTNFDFVGTYDASATIDEGDYYIGGNKLWKSDGAATIKGTRAYLKARTAGAKIRLVIDGEDATAIEAIEITGSDVENGNVYDMSGRLVKNPVRGLYIKNGKKVLVK